MYQKMEIQNDEIVLLELEWQRIKGILNFTACKILVYKLLFAWTLHILRANGMKCLKPML